jgi:hypothetical protein
MRRRFGGSVRLLQSDGGSEFEGELARQVHLFCERHGMARPDKKNEQSSMESCHRTLPKECLGWCKYQLPDGVRLVPRVEAFVERYHYHRPHLGFKHLGFKPMRPPLTRNGGLES